MLALLEGNPGADVVFVAHSGLDTVHTLQFDEGQQVGHTIKSRFGGYLGPTFHEDDARLDWVWGTAAG